MTAKDETPETICGKLDKPLAAGGRMQFHPTGAGPRLQARWSFNDVTDSGDVDLCSNAHIVFAD
jgi:hypothetical protein